MNTCHNRRAVSTTMQRLDFYLLPNTRSKYWLHDIKYGHKSKIGCLVNKTKHSSRANPPQLYLLEE